MSKFFGNLTYKDLFFYPMITDPSTNTFVAGGAALVLVFGAIIVIGLITYYKVWGVLFKDWIFSTDHKRIGIMYIVVALVMLLRGVIEGVVMRVNQAYAYDGGAPLAPEHFAELFSTHGTIMILFVAVPMVSGLINIVLPLQIGARDMAFPVMNQVSLGLFTAAAAIVMISLAIGKFETGGWTAYPPYTGKVFNPDEGVDYWIWCVVISGIGTTLSGVNFATTIFKCRAPGMKLMYMPLFVWTALIGSVMMIYATPPLTLVALMNALDRYLDFHFFTNDLGGNVMNYANIFWMFGHPEVYLLVLPAYGVWSEVVETFSAKPLYGYKSLVFASIAIAFIAFAVWLHHFFTMGQSATVNIAFGFATMLISIPTGVKVYDWMGTMYKGRVRMETPMVYMMGFFILFTIGGLTGVILAHPTIDYQVHNTLFLVAHFHNALIPGVLFAILAGIHYWWPKVFGFRLSEKWGKRAAWLWIIGFSFTFLPLYVLGLKGMPRRSPSFDNASFIPWEIVAAVGSLIVFAALITVVICYFVSIRDRKKLAVPVGDPWDGRTLEWSISAPPPAWNFAVIPEVKSLDAFAYEKEHGTEYKRPAKYEDIELSNSTSFGFVMLLAAAFLAMALTWYIWWLVVVSLLVILVAFIRRAFDTNTTKIVPASEVKKTTEAWYKLIEKGPAVTRDEEASSENIGLAAPDIVPDGGHV